MNWKEVRRKYETSDKATNGYFPIYERLLDGREVGSVLEVGVREGTSLRMWHDLYPEARIVGVDIAYNHFQAALPDGIEVIIGDATKVYVKDSFDLIVDDGSHLLDDIELTILNLSSHLAPGGMYVVEDTLAERADLPLAYAPNVADALSGVGQARIDVPDIADFFMDGESWGPLGVVSAVRS